jgi:hypothetical protein
MFDGSSDGEARVVGAQPRQTDLTFKLRRDMKFDRRAPTNGRSRRRRRVVELNNTSRTTRRRSLAYDNKQGCSRRIVSAGQEYGGLQDGPPGRVDHPAVQRADKFYVFREANAFDPRKDIRGSGPWILEEYVPSARIVWAKNPDYYVKGRPFPDKIEVPILRDPSQQMAQFRAGNIYSDVMGGFGGFQLEIVPAHKDLPETVIHEEPVFPERNIWYMTFGFDGNSPFKDTRMRQAMSMMIDRDGYLDVIDNRQKFAEQGLQLNYKLCTILGAGWGDYWLDPNDTKAFGITTST